MIEKRFSVWQLSRASTKNTNVGVPRSLGHNGELFGPRDAGKRRARRVMKSWMKCVVETGAEEKSWSAEKCISLACWRN